ncbi:MAG: prepilin peptidase, partial [Paraglaciecola sp.]
MHSSLQLMADYPAVFISVVFVISLLVGSFLNVVIYRLPVMMERGWKAEVDEYLLSQNTTHQVNASQAPDANTSTPETFNLVKPDSTCPKCQHKIRAWENIPVISWLALGGKCSQCKSPIPIRY